MIHGARYVRQDVSYLSKKHSCPVCFDTPLNIIKVSKVINSSSGAAKEIPPIVPQNVIGTRGVRFRRYTAVGNIKWIWKEFECPSCCRRFTVEQMKQIDATPKERWEEMVASFDDPPAQTSEKKLERELANNTQNSSKKKRNLAIFIASIVIVITLAVSVVIALSSSSSFVDTNGTDNFALTEITKENILELDSNYRSSMEAKTSLGTHTNVIGTRLREYDRDIINISYGKIYGVTILQATRILGNALTLNINSSVESGNAEIVILIDGEYYCSVDVNQNQSIVLQDISNKDVIVKLAGEDAKIKVSISRIY